MSGPAASDELRWDPPGPGGWWLELEHFPRPVTALFADLFPPATAGWLRGAARYGRARRPSAWARVNGWLYYGAGGAGAEVAADPEEAARAAAEHRWCEETRRWLEEERPRVVAGNLALQDEDVGTLDLGALRDHVARAFDQYRTSAPLHFEHQGDHAVNDALRAAAAAAGLETLDLGELYAGSSPASSAPAARLRAVAEALRAAGLGAGDVTSLADVHRVPEAAEALDAYLREYGHRLVGSYDLIEPTLGEQPAVVLAGVRAALADRWPSPPAPAVPPWRDGATGVDEAAARELDRLLAEGRAAHALRDDDDGTCFFWPMGLVRRAVLEAGRRLVADGRALDEADVFEATTDEMLALLDGDADPSADELRRRTLARSAAERVAPPASLHEPPPAPATTSGDGPWHGTGIGTGRARGPVVVHHPGDDALTRLEPGDVLVTRTTTPAFNTVFPLLAAIVTAEGGAGSHAALVARELGIPAVLGVRDILDAIDDGRTVEVDAATGTVS